MKRFWAKLSIWILFVETKERNLHFMLIWLNLTIKQSLIFDFFQYFFHGSKNASGVLWGTYWKNSEQNYQYASFLWKRKKRNLFFMLIWMNSTIKQSLIFDFFFPISLSLVQKCIWSTGGTSWNVSEQNYQSVSFLSKRRKRNLFFTIIWLYLTMKWSLIFDFFFRYIFYRSKNVSGVLRAPNKTFWAKLPICILFVETKKKKPFFHVDLIEFDHKTIPEFRFFPISLSLVQKCIWSTGGTSWNVSEQNYQSVSFLSKRRKRNLFFTIIWLYLTIKWSLILDFFSDISFIGPKMFLEYWGHLLKTFGAKLPIRIVFVETKKKKPIFHDYSIVFEYKMILDFWFFPISLL